jgi:curved DNA-binding protein CbpA
MTDYFALLGEPRRPWLEPAAIREKFLARSGGLHPDKIHAASDAEKAAAAAAFAELNAAQLCLADPKARLRHLLELERGAKPADIQQIPSALAGLFIEVSTACRNVDTLLAEKAATTSPLLLVGCFERSQAWIETLDALRLRLQEFDRQLADQLKALDAKWPAAEAASHAALLAEAEELYRLFGYFNRWNRQLTERKLLLMT